MTSQVFRLNFQTYKFAVKTYRKYNGKTYWSSKYRSVTATTKKMGEFEAYFWKQLNDMIDFSFVVDMIKDKYSSTMGRTAEDVIRMFKYLLLKSYFK